MKIYIVGLSICRLINMLEFESSLDRGTLCKRYFRDATVSQLCSYIETVLREEVPDKVIMRIEANNLTKKKQSNMDAAKEISGK